MLKRFVLLIDATDIPALDLLLPAFASRQLRIVLDLDLSIISNPLALNDFIRALFKDICEVVCVDDSWLDSCEPRCKTIRDRVDYLRVEEARHLSCTNRSHAL